MKIEDIIGKRSKQFLLRNITKEDLLPLHELLKKHNYTEKSVFQRLGVIDIEEILLKFLPVYLDERLKENSPLDKLIKIFILAQSLDGEEAEELFGGDNLKLYARIGLILKEQDKYKSPVAIFPCMDGFFATDHMFTTHYTPNTVYPLGLDSYLLARGMLNITAENTLDMCTGCGVHGILAAKYSKKVTGVDKNPRAVNFAKFNALLNQVDNTRFLAGDLYEPLKGEKFDWIIANPPFVPSPDTKLYFRHGSSSGEGISKRVTAGIPEFLADNGYAQLVSSIVFRQNENYVEKVRRWLGTPEFHVLVLASGACNVEKYILDHITTDPASPEFHNDLKTWVDSYRENGITAVADGLIYFKKLPANAGNIKNDEIHKPEAGFITTPEISPGIHSGDQVDNTPSPLTPSGVSPSSSPFYPGQSDFRKFRVPGSDIFIGDRIKGILNVFDAYIDENQYEDLVKNALKIADDINFWWDGTEPSGRKNYGILFQHDALFESEMIDEKEKTLLDLISKGTGLEDMKPVFKKLFGNDANLKESLLKLMKKGAVEIK